MSKEPQLEFGRVKGWGGKRRGAGRKNLSKTVNHMKRPEINGKTPLHITWRLKERLPSLRRKTLLKEFRKSAKSAQRWGLFVNQFSLQRNHIHMVIEANSNESLAAGMRSLGGRFAKILRKYAYENENGARKGAVFNGRYHVHVLKTPTEMKNALEYVLLNEAKHKNLIEHLDPYSSAFEFRDWRALLGRRFSHIIRDQVEDPEEERKRSQVIENELSPPRSWLAREGWRRA